jgi:hypothetical protein
MRDGLAPAARGRRRLNRSAREHVREAQRMPILSATGERAGVTDQGQIAKMLARLARVGLLEDTGGGQAMGAPNARRLMLRGKELERAMQRESRGAGR